MLEKTACCFVKDLSQSIVCSCLGCTKGVEDITKQSDQQIKSCLSVKPFDIDMDELSSSAMKVVSGSVSVASGINTCSMSVQSGATEAKLNANNSRSSLATKAPKFELQKQQCQPAAAVVPGAPAP